MENHGSELMMTKTEWLDFLANKDRPVNTQALLHLCSGHPAFKAHFEEPEQPRQVDRRQRALLRAKMTALRFKNSPAREIEAVRNQIAELERASGSSQTPAEIKRAILKKEARLQALRFIGGQPGEAATIRGEIASLQSQLPTC